MVRLPSRIARVTGVVAADPIALVTFPTES